MTSPGARCAASAAAGLRPLPSKNRARADTPSDAALRAALRDPCHAVHRMKGRGLSVPGSSVGVTKVLGSQPRGPRCLARHPVGSRESRSGPASVQLRPGPFASVSAWSNSMAVGGDKNGPPYGRAALVLWPGTGCDRQRERRLSGGPLAAVRGRKTPWEGPLEVLRRRSHRRRLEPAHGD